MGIKIYGMKPAPADKVSDHNIWQLAYDYARGAGAPSSPEPLGNQIRQILSGPQPATRPVDQFHIEPPAESSPEPQMPVGPEYRRQWIANQMRSMRGIDPARARQIAQQMWAEAPVAADGRRAVLKAGSYGSYFPVVGQR